MNLPLQRLKILLFLCVFTSFGNLNAQVCDHIGLVGNGFLLGEFNCGLVIISSDGGQVLQPVKPSEELKLGQVIRFSYEVLDSAGCSEKVSLINITCLEPFMATGDCAAEFLAFPNDIFFSREYVFEPLFYDSTKIYQWDFGDGQQSTIGQSTHLYTSNGAFIVCLTVSDEVANCTETFCDTLSVSTPILNTCNFSIDEMAISDSVFQLEVFSQIDFGPYHPQTVQWYEYETGKLLGDTPIINYKPSLNSPPLINICAEVAVVYPDGNECQGTVCRTIFVDNSIVGTADCQAVFGYLPHSDPLGITGDIDFYNLSFGDFNLAEWDFGDGETLSTTAESFRHTYQSPGLYEACLTITNEVTGCSSKICLPVYSVGGAEICNYIEDCVLPGDTNKDGVVNIFDVLNVGVGFNSTGKIRPNAAIDFILQAAFNWDFTTTDAKNYKHIDADGNGMVNELDYLAIDKNYQKFDNQTVAQANPTRPEVSLKFAADTLYFNPNQSVITIPATLTVGTNDLPIDNFYGIALSLDYDGTLIESISTTYDTTSFMGKDLEVLSRQKHLTADNQLGFAATRTNQAGINGSGDIAEFGFVISHDIIEFKTVPVSIDLGGLTVVDENGVEIPVNVSSESAKVVIVFDENLTVNTAEQLKEEQFQVYPNPAKNQLIITLANEIDLTEGRVDIFNTLGQKVISQLLTQRMLLDVATIESGVYWVKIRTKDGVGIEEIIIE